MQPSRRCAVGQKCSCVGASLDMSAQLIAALPDALIRLSGALSAGELHEGYSRGAVRGLRPGSCTTVAAPQPCGWCLHAVGPVSRPRS